MRRTPRKQAMPHQSKQTLRQSDAHSRTIPYNSINIIYDMQLSCMTNARPVGGGGLRRFHARLMASSAVHYILDLEMCARRNDTEIDASRRPWPYIHTYAVLGAPAKAHCGSIALYHQISWRNHVDTYGIADLYYPMLTQIYHNSQSLCVEYNIFSRIWARPSAVCGTCCDLHMNWASQ